jgi:hypothetical protein
MTDTTAAKRAERLVKEFARLEWKANLEREPPATPPRESEPDYWLPDEWTRTEHT